MRSLMVMVLAATVVACGDRSDRVDFSGEDLGPDLHAITTDDGALKMGLTREWVYFTLSDSVRSEIESELAAKTDSGGVKGFFGGLMRSAVGKALGFRARYAVAEIRDIRWEDGRMVVEFTDPDRGLDDNLTTDDDEPITEAFAETDVQALSEVFRGLKGGETGDTDG
jgi:hypothetical protein